MKITREQALEVLDELIKNENLKKHMYCVEAGMRFYAKEFGEDEEKWGLAGLLHDADWEKYPKEHPGKIIEKLKEIGVDEDIIYAISSHGNSGDYGDNHFDFQPRKSLMDKALFAVDELSGFVIACALVRPDKLDSLKPKSVKKKLKDKKFAAQVSREDIYQGVEELSIELDEHIENIIEVLKGVSLF